MTPYETGLSIWALALLDEIRYQLEAVLDRIERVDEPAYTGYALDHACQTLRDTIAMTDDLKTFARLGIGSVNEANP